MHVGVLRQPRIVLLMRAVVIENHMNLLLQRSLADHVVEEGLKVRALLSGSSLRLNGSGGDVQGGNQVDRAVALVGALQPAHQLTAAGENLGRLALQSLDRGVL